MCELTAGENYTCDAAGGVDKVYIFPVRDDAGESTIASYATTGGNVTDLVLVDGKKAFTFNIEAETASFTDDSVGEKVAGSNAYTHTSTVVLHGNTAETIVNVENLDSPVKRRRRRERSARQSYNLCSSLTLNILF